VKPTSVQRNFAIRTWLSGAGLALAQQFAKFGVVGVTAFVIDVGLFNVNIQSVFSAALVGGTG